MWNQTIYQNKSSYYSYSNKRKQQLAKLSKYKLFILLISRYTYRVLKQSLCHVQNVTQKQNKIFQRMILIAKNNHFNCIKESFRKFKQNTIICRKQDNTIKNFTILLERILKYKLKKSFSLIQLHSYRKSHLMFSNIQQMRKIIFSKKVQRIFIYKKHEYFEKIREFSIYNKKLLKKVKLAGIIGKQYIKNVLQACFNRLSKYIINQQVKKPVLSARQQSQSKQLRIRLQDMSVQLQNKMDCISRLQQQIQQLKTQQPVHNYNSFSQYTLSNHLNKSRSIHFPPKKPNQNDSIDSNLDFSIGSILGNSFSLNKSLSKSFKRPANDSVASIQCNNCHYKQKYLKLKSTNQSLKNQLQIVKQQLDVAKDLNDHFTNQIKQYFGGQKDQIQLDRLRKEIKQLQRQKQQLKIKVTKYQGHIMTLKSEFKIKIQELYRKVKKQR